MNAQPEKRIKRQMQIMGYWEYTILKLLKEKGDLDTSQIKKIILAKGEPTNSISLLGKILIEKAVVTRKKEPIPGHRTGFKWVYSITPEGDALLGSKETLLKKNDPD